MKEYFQFITPSIYLLLVCIWAYILIFYLKKIIKNKKGDKLLLILLLVLAIDALRTLLESSYFGVWYTSLAGLIPIGVYNYLAKPEIVFFPKIINLIVSLIILVILIKRWLPAETSKRASQVAQIQNHTKELQEIIDNLNVTQNELLEQKQLFEIMFNTIPDGVVITNTNREILLANKGMKNTFGYKPDEIIGKTIEMLYSDKKLYDDKGASIFNKEVPDSEKFYITYYKTKNNVVFPGETYGIKLYDRAGVWKGNLSITRNVSERIDFIDKLKKAKERAEESDRLKSAFLANMSHEIRTPMNGILGFTELLKETQLSGEETTEYIKIIEKSGKRMLDTINDIVDISKIEAGQVEVVKTEVLVNQILEELYHFFLPDAKSKGLKLNYTPSLTDKEALIVTDQYKLLGILTNLIKNAIKFTEHGEISISCSLKKEAHAHTLEFAIKDTGIGIAPDRTEAIFNRFEQADIQDTRVFEGSGLGLAISKSYVEMLGGNIRVFSEVGKGSLFVFSIPYVNKSVKKMDIAAEENKNAPNLSHNLSVIVAEDDEVSQLLLKTILENEVSNISFVGSGQETIDKFRENPDTDIILMDINMPGMSGYTATREIRKFNRDVIIIAQTAFGLSGDRQKAINAGCNDYIAKPIKKEELFDKIRILLDRKSS